MLCRRRSQLKATLVFTVFLLLALPVFSILDTAGKKCKTDNNCSPPYYLCMDAICTRKPLFPMTGSEIGALVTMILILMFSVTVSIADPLGKVVRSERILVEGEVLNTMLSTSGFVPGTYSVTVTTPDRNWVKRMVVR